jgi:hypothetical protein
MLLDTHYVVLLARKGSYVRNVSLDTLTHLDMNFATEGEVKIHTRAKLDEAKVLIDIDLLPYLGIGNDTASNGSCYLTHEDRVSSFVADDDGRTFVVGAALR